MSQNEWDAIALLCTNADIGKFQAVRYALTVNRDYLSANYHPEVD
jgi:hypothetical protein